jgi:hypothetical protein
VKQSLLPALLGTVIGVAAGALLVDRRGDPEPAGAGAASDLAPVLVDLARVLRSLEARAATAPALAPGTTAETPRPVVEAPPSAPRLPSASPPESPPTTPRTAGRAETPPADRETVKALLSWPREEDGELDTTVRRRWLFATEAEVLEAFGTPDQINGGADEERWVYHVDVAEDGGTRKTIVDLRFWNGRLRKVY